MTKFLCSTMPRRGLTSFLGVLLTLLIFGGSPLEGQALPDWIARQTAEGNQPSLKSSSGMSLQEVAPPTAVQRLRQQLDRHHPDLQLISPGNDEVIASSEAELVLEVKDWPLVNDRELGGGPHVMVQIDALPSRRLDQAEGDRLHLTLAGLQPGSHRFSAWAAYPWGEAVKSPGASLQGRFHLWQKLDGTQPNSEDPWLVPVSSADGQSQQQLLLDWLIWNAPLQNLREGDGRWRVRISVNGDSFLMDRQDPLWIRHKAEGRGTDIQMELVNGLGEPLQPVFNNNLLHLPAPGNGSPAWLRSNLSDHDLLVLSGEAPDLLGQEQNADTDAKAGDSEDQADVEVVKPEAAAVASIPEVESESVNQLGTQRDAIQESEGKVDQLTTSEPELAPSDPELTTPTPELTPSEPELTPRAPEESSEPSVVGRRFPTSELGGSARELLNDDGSLRDTPN